MASRPTFVVLLRSFRPDFTLENMTPEEKTIMQAHGLYLRQLLAEKKLILAGPCLDGAFGLGVFEADSAEDMRQMLEHDPAATSGAFFHEWHPVRIGFLRVPEEPPTA
jgi:uncharacterized protein YciI